MKYAAIVASFVVLALTSARAETQSESIPEAKPKDYDLTITQTPAAAVAGQQARITVTIQPHAPWTLKVATPFEASFQGTTGVALEKTKLSSKDFLDVKTPEKAIGVTFTPEQKGEHVISGELSFFLCTDQVCQRFKESVQHKLLVP